MKNVRSRGVIAYFKEIAVGERLGAPVQSLPLWRRWRGKAVTDEVLAVRTK